MTERPHPKPERVREALERRDDEVEEPLPEDQASDEESSEDDDGDT
jgi:hypothetical protein